MANRLLLRTLLDNVRVPVGARFHSDVSKIGSRDIVGYGMNGQANYIDRADFPMPAVRFREESNDIKVLRQKEKGDWRKLSIEEKKELYRASFCQTFAEFKAPTGEWKGVIGYGLMLASLSIWLYMALKLFVYHPIPDSFSEERQKAQLKRMLDLRIGAVDGLSSKWDYENNRWK